MATKKTAVIPEEEILAAATDENINEHALHQTETEPEPDRVLSAEGAPGDADLIDICQTDSESANPEGMPIEDAARNTPEAPVSQTDSDLEEKNLKRARRPAEPENQELRKVSLTQQRQNRPGMHPTASNLRRRSLAGAPLPDRRRRWYPSTSAPVWKRKRTKPATICWTW